MSTQYETTVPESNEGVPTIEEPTPADLNGADADDATEGKADSPKKAISLRVAVEDLELARELAQELELGYQVLLNQIIHQGLTERRQDLEYARLVTRFRTSLSELKAAQDLVGSPAVKAAQELLSSPAIKAAQDLLDSPAIKAAQEAVSGPIQKVRDFSASTATKASEDFATSPLGRAIHDLTQAPAFQAAQDLAKGTGEKLQREWEKSPGGRLAGAIRDAAQASKPEELADLTKAVKDIQDALKKAGLL